MGIAVHLFYFISAWRQAAEELLPLVRGDGPIVLMHTGTGMEVPLVNQRYKELCTVRGYAIPEIGVTSTQEVAEYFASRGCRIEWIRQRWQWTAHIRLAEALRYIAPGPIRSHPPCLGRTLCSVALQLGRYV